jgi:prenyltransferase beta subunit
LQPAGYYSETLGAFAADSGFNAWGILGTLALSRTVPPGAVDALAGQQQPDGGWEWQPGFGTDTNTTALAVQTLVAAGYPVTTTEVVSALAFLKNGQVAGGGFVYDPAAPENGADANSTAYALMALVAAGEDPTADAWQVDGENAVDFLVSLQAADGSIEWQAGTGPNLLATAQAATALLGRSFPLAVGQLTACRR